ncbi:DUF928 domain-containing protein [Leptolyngbya cf. ectocarpi LEGE 11479]|uniref:DUF928 domain-containing protein n=1 Tax=Leptolyngbya cf. ectocarpi LEGE 11479 TaxID=1828722 RepID=A0A928ZVM7_LEPEC|nr:DUF928 domain-containing protein [Leptolyngbya ectocarpi]MBE9068308.1 DUF928 domain-containing protein [Leptolyngbya cf. ectocarpi LEGE 11479]
MKSHQAISCLLGSLCLLSQLPITRVQAELVDWTTQPDSPALDGLDVAAANPIGEIAYNYNAPILADRGTPLGRRGAGSRSGSLEDDSNLENICMSRSGPSPLIALVPSTQESRSSETPGRVSPKNFESVLSLTTQSKPTFWFYLPARPDDIPLEFVLQIEHENQTDETVYQTQLSGNHSAGIMRLTLPEDAPTLQLNTRYRWFFSVGCDSGPVNVSGSIDLVSLDPALQLSLAEATPREQVAIYASNGLWQDAITLLGELYRADSDNISRANDWYSLLESVGLEDIAQQPLIDCCTP